MPDDRDDIAAGMVTLLGVPWDEGSSFLRGPAAAPACIRSALFDSEANWSAENVRNVVSDARLFDAGDVTCVRNDPPATVAAIADGVGRVLARNARVLSLGGDHSVSYPLVKAHAAHVAPFTIVQIDAHPDLYDDFEGDRLSHACPFARIMEEGLARGLVQIGIRAPTPHQDEQADRFGVRQFVATAGAPPVESLPEGPVYLSVDMDGLDPAFAPGVSHPEPGGLSTREVITIIQRLPGPIVGADVVEYNPRRDVHGATALVAATLVKEIAARMLES